jgi:uncharacterized protein (DUF362 family)
VPRHETHRVAARGLDDVVVFDAVGDARPGGPAGGMADHRGAAKPSLDAVAVDVDAQALAIKREGALQCTRKPLVRVTRATTSMMSVGAGLSRYSVRSAHSAAGRSWIVPRRVV